MSCGKLKTHRWSAGLNTTCIRCGASWAELNLSLPQKYKRSQKKLTEAYKLIFKLKGEIRDLAEQLKDKVGP